MALIIPEAQTPFSLVEQPRLNPNQPNIGDGVAAVADSMIEIKARKVQAEQDRQLRAARLDAINGLDEIRFKYETDTNLDNLTDRWEAEASAYTGQIAASLPAHLRKDFELGMRETVLPQTSAIRRREYALWQDQEAAALNADLRGYEKAAALAPDDAAREAIYAEAGKAIGRAQSLGLLSAVDADAMMASLPRNAEGLAMMQMVDEDPAAALQALEDPEQFTWLTGEDRVKWRQTAKANADRDAVAVARQNELLAKQADTELSNEVNAAIDVIDGGRRFTGLSDLIDRAKGTPHYDRLISAVDGAGTSANFALQSPAEQVAILRDLEDQATGDPADVGRLNRMRGVHERTVKGLAEDRLGWVASVGAVTVDPVDIADPQSVTARIAMAETVHRDFTPEAAEIIYFSKAEATRLSGILAGPDPEQALGVLAAITSNFGDRAPLAMAQIGASDPSLQLAGALMLETGDLNASRTLLTGRALRKGQKGATVSAEVARSVEAEFAPAFAGQPERLANLMQAAQDYYAAGGLGTTDPKGPDAAAGLRQAALAVSGATKRGGVQYGGLQTVNEHPALLPADLDAPRVETALRAFDASHWSRAAVSGKPPKGFDQWSSRDREDWVILPAPRGSPSGTYALGYRRRNGSIEYLQDGATAGGIFLFDLHSLVTGVR